MTVLSELSLTPLPLVPRFSHRLASLTTMPSSKHDHNDLFHAQLAGVVYRAAWNYHAKSIQHCWYALGDVPLKYMIIR